MTRTVIVGASVAGLAAALGLRDSGYTGDVVLLGDEPHLPYDRPPLSKQILTGEWDADRLWLCDPARLEQFEISHRSGSQAVGLNAESREISLSSGGTIGYTDLIIATGVRPRIPAAWASLDGVTVLRTLDHALSLRHRLREATHVVVIGAGFIGAEVAASVTGLGHAVTIVDPLPFPMARVLPPALGAMLAREHAARGVQLHCGVSVRDLEATDRRVTGIWLSDGRRLEADLVVVGLGSTPNTEWLAGSGIPLVEGVFCDEHCRAADHVYAVGDVASWVNPRFGRMRLEHRMHAAEQAEHVARTIASGGATDPFAPIPFFWSDQFGMRLQAYGDVRPTDEFTVIEGSIEGQRLVGACARDGRIVAILAVNMPRHARLAQTLIGEAADVVPELAQTAGTRRA
jgi:NADPH-dependent 2,4-dienoyl-CoA reductase/sulfur reductase-like enzyme